MDKNVSSPVISILARAFKAFLGLEEEEDMSRIRHKGRKERRENVQEFHSRSGGVTLEDYDPSTGQVGINRKHRKKKNKPAPPKEHRKCAYIFATKGVKDESTKRITEPPEVL